MTSPLINAAVTALAHERLRILHDALARKRRIATGRFFDNDAPNAVPGGWSGIQDVDDPAVLTPVQVRAVEKQVQELARRALAILERDRAPTPPGLPRTGGTSKFAFLGATGNDWPAWRPDHAWVANLIRRGSRDPNLSAVIAPATAVAFETAIQAAVGAGADEAWRARAFGLGMITAQAANVVMNPLLRGASRPVRDGTTPDIDAAVLARTEAALKRHLFTGATTDQLTDWWPVPDDVTDRLLGAYTDALRTEANFEHPDGLPGVTYDRGRELDAAVLRTTYYLTRSSSTSWGFLHWLAYLLLFSVPVAAVLPIASAIDTTNWKAKRIFYREAAGAPGSNEESYAQIALLSSALATVGPTVTNAVLWASLPVSDNAPFWAALAGNVLDGLGALFLALSQGGGDAWAAVRWITILVQAVYRFALMGVGIRSPSGFPSTHFWIQTFPLWATLGTVLFAWLIDLWVGDADTDDKAQTHRWVLMAIWAAILFAVHLGFAIKLDGRSLWAAVLGATPPRLADLDGLPAGDTSPHALASLLDESTLWSASAATPYDMIDLRYPEGARPILTMWWTLDSDLQVHHAGNTLTFRIGDGPAVQRIVLPPIAFTPAELGAYLSATVTGRGPGAPGPAGGLVCRPAIAGDSMAAVHPRPYPQVVEDTGGVFVSVGRDERHAYELRHARRGDLATRFGQRGPAVTTAEGWPIGPGPGAGGSEGAGVGMAADLASLLALGAASRLHPDPDHFPDDGGPDLHLGRVSQVFRRWNLDERRVNEWRMLIAGGAASERPARAPVGPTEAVPADPVAYQAGASPPVLVGTEALANAMGWVPAFRAWSRVAADPVEDTTAAQAAPYTPRVRLGPGLEVQPTNQQLSEVVRFLLDLP